MSMRCAIYARYSTDMQLERSIQDQIRRCREYASQFRDFEIIEAYGLCGCNLVIVSGGGTKKKRYGCANYRFHHTCSNNFTIGVGNLENQLIQKFRLKLQDSAHRDLFRNGMSAALTKGVLARQLESFVLTPLSRDGIRQFQVTVDDHVTVTFLIAC